MSYESGGALAELALQLGVNAEEVASDEHARWELYRRALAEENDLPLLLATVRGEPSLPLASATVVWALEHRSANERDRWLRVLPPGPFLDHARRRATELAILRSLRDDRAHQVSPADVDSWSRWLQLRVAEESDREDVLAILRSTGATKRVRRLAHDREIHLRS